MPKLDRSTWIVLAVIVVAAGAYFLLNKGTQTGGSGPPLVQVTVPTLTARAQQGEQLFNANCAKCHGINAAGQDGVAPPLVHKIYEPNHHADISFQRAARFGVRAHHWPFGNMPPVSNVSAKDVTKIIAYVRELQRANGIN